jgi:hypothetical protein
MAVKKVSGADKFALIDCNYKKLAIPVDFLPELLKHATLVETEYVDGEYEPTGVHSIRKFEVVDALDIENALAQQKLRS